jgi:hypothetical protein
MENDWTKLVLFLIGAILAVVLPYAVAKGVCESNPCAASISIGGGAALLLIYLSLFYRKEGGESD